MTEIINGICVLKEEKPQQCDYCGEIAELRPYGKNGACICFKCGTKPENKETTETMFMKFLKGK